MISILHLNMSFILLKMSFIHVTFLEHILSIHKSLRCIQDFRGCIYIFFMNGHVPTFIGIRSVAFIRILNRSVFSQVKTHGLRDSIISLLAALKNFQ